MYNCRTMARQSRLILPSSRTTSLQRGNDRQLIFRDDGGLRALPRLAEGSVPLLQRGDPCLRADAEPPAPAGHAGRRRRPGADDAEARAASMCPGSTTNTSAAAACSRGGSGPRWSKPTRYFLACSRYIELNPVRAQLAADAGRLSVVQLRPPRRRARRSASERPLAVLGAGQYAIPARGGVHRSGRSRACPTRSSKRSTRPCSKGWPLGTDAFKADLERKTKRQILPAKRGRPFKKPPLADAENATEIPAALVPTPSCQTKRFLAIRCSRRLRRLRRLTLSPFN